MAMETQTPGKTIQLRDGRTLGYLEYGNPNGKPLLYFHGHPGARLEAGFLAAEAKKQDVRLIGIDRPGLGLSTYKRGRHFLDWPDDVVELADQLKIDRFAVVGFSGGGPYALACAYKIPERLTACGVVSSVGRSGYLISFLSMWIPWIMLPLTSKLFADETKVRATMTKFASKWVEPDRKALERPEVMDVMASSLVESNRQGTKGAAYDGTLIGARNWDFQLEAISFQNIHLWHGEVDNEIKVAQAQESAKRLPHCQATFYPNDGHISTIANHAADIVTALVR